MPITYINMKHDRVTVRTSSSTLYIPDFVFTVIANQSTNKTSETILVESMGMGMGIRHSISWYLVEPYSPTAVIHHCACVGLCLALKHTSTSTGVPVSPDAGKLDAEFCETAPVARLPPT